MFEFLNIILLRYINDESAVLYVIIWRTNGRQPVVLISGEDHILQHKCVGRLTAHIMFYRNCALLKYNFEKWSLRNFTHDMHMTHELCCRSMGNNLKQSDDQNWTTEYQSSIEFEFPATLLVNWGQEELRVLSCLYYPIEHHTFLHVFMHTAFS